MTASEIVAGISQVLASKFDGITDAEGKKIEIGLERDSNTDYHERSIVDGFNGRICGDTFILSYNCEYTANQMHNKNFKDDIEEIFDNLVKFIKKQFREVTGSSLSLTKPGDLDILVQPMNKIRNLVQAKQTFHIGGMDEVETVGEESERKLDKTFEKFLSQGKQDAKKPTNVKIGKEDNQKKVLKESPERDAPDQVEDDLDFQQSLDEMKNKKNEEVFESLKEWINQPLDSGVVPEPKFSKGDRVSVNGENGTVTNVEYAEYAEPFNHYNYTVELDNGTILPRPGQEIFEDEIEFAKEGSDRLYDYPDGIPHSRSYF